MLAITDVDYAQRFPAYDSEFGAARILIEQGGIEGLLTVLLGEPSPPNLIRRGDVVVATIDGREASGICLGTTCAFAALRGGLVFLSRECITCGWRID